MIVDSHCHIYPDRIAERAVAGTGEFYHMPLRYDGRLSTLFEAGREGGVTHHVVFSVATKPEQSSSINRFIAGEVAQGGGRLVGLGTVHPDSPHLKEDIEEILSLGLKGVKLHPDMQRFKIDDYRCLKIYELCEGRLPVLIHCGDHRFDFSNPNRMKPILDIFTELQVIGAHFGGWSMWDDAMENLSGYANFTVDTSSSMYAMSPEKALSLIRAYGVDHVIFGSDYPMWPPAEELKRLSLLGLSEAEMQSILYKNAAALFDIPIA